VFASRAAGLAAAFGPRWPLHRAREDAPSGDADQAGATVLSVWQYVGSGYLNPGDMLLAADVEASLRAAREALADLRHGPP
jgi:hypothetical protein